MEERIKELEKKITDLEMEVQSQQKELEKAIAFLFDRSYYKEQIREGKEEWPSALYKALKRINY